MEFVTQNAAKRLLHIADKKQLHDLVGQGLLRQSDGRYCLEDLQKLMEWRAGREYVQGLENVDFARPVGLAVSLTDPELSPGLKLSDANGAQEALAEYESGGGGLQPGQFLAGWWRVEARKLKYLVDNRAPILGITANIVWTGAWIDAVAATNVLDGSRAFVVTPMTADEFTVFRGVAKANQKGAYVQLPD